MEEGVCVLCSTKGIAAVFLVYFCKITYYNYLVKEIPTSTSKGRWPRWHLILRVEAVKVLGEFFPLPNLN